MEVGVNGEVRAGRWGKEVTGPLELPYYTSLCSAVPLLYCEPSDGQSKAAATDCPDKRIVQIGSYLGANTANDYKSTNQYLGSQTR